MKRLRLIQMSGELLQQMMTQGNTWDAICTKGLPEGAKCVTWAFKHVQGDAPDLLLWFEHESFDPVPSNESAPHFIPEYTRLPEKAGTQ